MSYDGFDSIGQAQELLDEHIAGALDAGKRGPASWVSAAAALLITVAGMFGLVYLIITGLPP